MKNIILLSIIIVLFSISCERPVTEIADNSEIPIKNYYQQIYAQPIIVDEQIISVIKNETSIFLKSYNKDGNLNWETNIDEYIIEEHTFDDIENINLSIKLNQSNEIVLNIDNWDNVKLIKFDKQGNYINQFEQTVYQPDTIFFKTKTGVPDTITNTNDSIPYFDIKNVFTLSNGNILILSHQKSNLMDSTIFQFSLYDDTGKEIGHNYSFFRKKNENEYYIENFMDSKDNLIFIFEWLYENPGLFRVNLSTGEESYLQIPLKYSNLFTFFEDSKNNYIFTGEIYNDNISNYSSLLFKINAEGELLWQKMGQFDLASIFLSVNEVADGYILTGFSSSKNYVESIDWRDNNGFIKERNAKAIVMKTDYDGNRIWNYTPNIQKEATFGGVTLFTDKLTFFGQRINNTIINTVFIEMKTEDLKN